MTVLRHAGCPDYGSSACTLLAGLQHAGCPGRSYAVIQMRVSRNCASLGLLITLWRRGGRGGGPGGAASWVRLRACCCGTWCGSLCLCSGCTGTTRRRILPLSGSRRVVAGRACAVAISAVLVAAVRRLGGQHSQRLGGGGGMPAAGGPCDQPVGDFVGRPGSPGRLQLTRSCNSRQEGQTLTRGACVALNLLLQCAPVIQMRQQVYCRDRHSNKCWTAWQTDPLRDLSPNALTTCQSQKELLKKWVLGAAGPPSAPASAAAGDASSLLDGASSDELLCSACTLRSLPSKCI